MEFEKGVEILNFLKRKKEEANKYRDSNKIILLERRQINKDNPAIAQLRIEFPSAKEGFKDYFDDKITKFPLGHVHEFTQISTTSCVIEIRSMKLMYAWFEYFIDCMRKDFENVEVKGVWDKYE